MAIGLYYFQRLRRRQITRTTRFIYDRTNWYRHPTTVVERHKWCSNDISTQTLLARSKRLVFALSCTINYSIMIVWYIVIIDEQQVGIPQTGKIIRQYNFNNEIPNSQISLVKFSCWEKTKRFGLKTQIVSFICLMMFCIAIVIGNYRLFFVVFHKKTTENNMTIFLMCSYCGRLLGFRTHCMLLLPRASRARKTLRSHATARVCKSASGYQYISSHHVNVNCIWNTREEGLTFFCLGYYSDASIADYINGALGLLFSCDSIRTHRSRNPSIQRDRELQ